jgi:hypothetical protein
MNLIELVETQKYQSLKKLVGFDLQKRDQENLA